jgi:hypothetical protein
MNFSHTVKTKTGFSQPSSASEKEEEEEEEEEEEGFFSERSSRSVERN